MSRKIHVEILDDAEAVGRKAAARILAVVERKPEAVLGLATGSTPIPAYRELVKLAHERKVSFAGVKTFNLDEYLGLSGSHPQSYRQYMNRYLFEHLDIPLWQTALPDGAASDPEAECAAFEARIRAAGGVDLWLLGIGSNGHIGFNEPGAPRDCRTRVASLAPSTIEASAKDFGGAAGVPRQALTAGVATILEAREILLLATGAGKAPAVAGALEGPITPQLPASYLQAHPSCAFVLDRAAASKLVKP